ncbi:type II toxin-antitoxin system RelE/ParE family toxin [Histophilus somni]|uniref:type II toxin-antitoxin system RelE/ParE family toxin n=2 Tax=Histophilus somni TaxID=731 RepID=UPI000165FA14|nr:type II toxin-antitoxin system RelE/ParE family toxin [Histophilus somni]ACA31875.1 Addiction module killer protein HI1419 [Histophilus somni 2336]
MYSIKQTSIFKQWLKNIKDPIARIMVIKRIERAKNGNFGDHKLLANTGGIYEMRIDTGKGYRIYYAKIEDIIYLLTNGGDKKTQQQDISDAQVILEKFKQLGDDENE